MAVIRLIEPGEELHERGLARAVGPDQANPLPRADLERKVQEDGITGILAAKAVSGDEDHEVARLLRVK